MSVLLPFSHLTHIHFLCLPLLTLFHVCSPLKKFQDCPLLPSPPLALHYSVILNHMETVLLQCPVLSQGPEVQLYSCHQNTYQKQSISPLMVRVLALVPCWQFLYQVGIMYELVYCSCCTSQLCYCMYICVHVTNALLVMTSNHPNPT